VGWRHSTSEAIETCDSTLLPRARDHSDHACRIVSRYPAWCVVHTRVCARPVRVQSKGQTYSTGFLRFKTSPSNAHNTPSTSLVGMLCCTPLSRSWGPMCASFGGKWSEKRDRNITMNCDQKVSIQSVFCLRRDTRVASAPFRVYQVGDSRQCLGCRLESLHVVVRAPSWAEEGRPLGEVRPSWWLSSPFERWARVS